MRTRLIWNLKRRLNFRFASVSLIVSFLSIVCALCSQIIAQDFRTVHDGVEYARVDHKIGNDLVKISLLRLDLKKVRLDVHHAHDKAIGLETTSSIAKRKGAVAAINAGFFRLDMSKFAGDAAGVLKVDGKVLSENVNGRVALGISNGKKTDVAFAHINTSVAILNLGLSVDGIMQIDGINRQRKSHEIILFTPEFGRTTQTDNAGDEYVIRRGNEWSPNGKIVEIRKGKGDSLIPIDGYVISGTGEKVEKLRVFFSTGFQRASSSVINDTLEVGVNKFFSDAEDIVAGVPQLIKNGKIDITWQQEKASRSFVETRHPRTAVAKLKDGKFLMMTVDGRQPGVSVGMTLQELAEYLLGLGAVDAMNLDGGGSTTMFLDGKVVNIPSDREGERKVGDAIIVTLRKRSARR